jgi:cytochrome b pre-mRNA-processing protein 3
MPADRPYWGLLPRRKTKAATATDIYGRLVTQARQRAFYAELGVPDTPEGRLELVMLHVVLMLRRLATEGESAAVLARSLTETFVRDMDDCLREMGVGDLTVAKKVKQAAAALFDRNRDYGAALERPDRAALSDLLTHHLLGGATGTGHPHRIADYAMSSAAGLSALSLSDIAGGRFQFAAITD